MTGPTGTRPLNEVRAAWVALESGAFAQPRMDWGAFGVDVAVVGAHGGAGATTVALALVEAGGSGQVLELAPVARAGLVAASRAEQGSIAPGWRRGRRGAVVIDILDQIALGGQVPVTTAASGHGLTVVDLGVLAGSLRGGTVEVVEVAEVVVVVARACVPGMRALAVALEQISVAAAIVVVVGAPVKRWERAVAAAMPALARAAHADGRLVTVPVQPSLTVTGITPDPLPKPVLAAAQHLHALVRGAGMPDEPLRPIPAAGHTLERTH